MSKPFRWLLYNRLGKNKWGKMSKRYQEKWTRFLINYYKKPYKSMSDIQERWEELRVKEIAAREEEKLIKKVKIAYTNLLPDLRPMDSYGDKNIGSRIIKGKKYGLINKSLESDIKHNKWLNYFNTKRTKYEIRRTDIEPFNKLMLEFKYIFNNITEGHKEDLESRKISNKLLKPHYYFPSKYIERSLSTQAKHWMSNVYSFIQRDATSITLLDRYSAELIKRFFSVKGIKRRLVTSKWKVYTHKLLKHGVKFQATKGIYKQINRIIQFSRKGAYKGNQNIATYFHPGILKSKWFKNQLRGSIKIKKKLLRRRLEIFGGYDTKKINKIPKFKRLLLGRPIFKHTPFNVTIDLFIFNNKTNQVRRLRNLMLRRFAYKYMYSLYADVYKKVNETLNRPRFFYINIIEPSVFPYYSKIVKSYEEWVFKYNKGLVITICLMLLKLHETYKKTINSVKKARKFSISRLNKAIKIKSPYLQNIYINILNKLGINNFFNIKKNLVDVISLYDKDEDSEGDEDKRPYKIRDYSIKILNTQPLNKKQLKQKIKRMKSKTRKKEKKKKKNERIKKFGEKKLSFNKYKKLLIYERRRGKQMDQTDFKKKLRDFHLSPHEKKEDDDDDSTIQKKYIWYSPIEWERRKKEKMIKGKSSKPNQKNKWQPRKNNISNNYTGNNNTYKNIFSVKNKNNGFNRNIINDKISNKNIKIKKPINKLLTKFKFEEVKSDKLISISKPIEIKSTENKDILLTTSQDLNTGTDNQNINGLGIIKYKFNILNMVVMTNYYKLYWDYKEIQSQKKDIKDRNLSKNKRRKIRIRYERENADFLKRNPKVLNLVKYFDQKIRTARKVRNKSKKNIVLNNIKSNVKIHRKLKHKKNTRSLKRSSYYISKIKWLRKQEMTRKEYALECIKNMNVPIIPKKKKFQKRVKKNVLQNINLVNKIEFNKKMQIKNTKKVWDKLEYSLLSILSKYLSVSGKDKFQANYMSLDSIYNRAKEMLIFSNIWYTIYSLSFIKNEYSNIVKNIIVSKVWDIIPENGDHGPNSYIKGNYINGIRRKCYSKLKSVLYKYNPKLKRVRNQYNRRIKRVRNKYNRKLKRVRNKYNRKLKRVRIRNKFFSKFKKLKFYSKLRRPIFYSKLRKFYSKFKLRNKRKFQTKYRLESDIGYRKHFSGNGNTDNKREGELQEKLFYYDNIFKTYYRKLIWFYIMEYYKHYVLYIWRNYWMHSLRMSIIDKVKGINKSHLMLLNFIIVKTLLGLLEYNYRSLIKIKPKYYYLNKLRYYKTKFKRINLNSWANSVKYVKKLRKTPNNFWKRYHRLASFYYGRIIQNAELDTKRKIFVPFVLYFEDVLYNIYGKWAIIRLWPLKRYYLSSYILARRLMALILWRARKVKTVTRFRIKTRYYLSAIRGFEITRGYYDYYKNSITPWPNSLVDMINEKRKEHYLSFKNLEYQIKRKERYHSFNTHVLYRNKLSYSHFSLWYYNRVRNNLYRTFKDKITNYEDDINFKSKYIYFDKWVKSWMKPFRLHLQGLTKGHDMSSLKFTLAGRTGTRRNNKRKTYKMRFYGHTRIPRYYAPIQWKFYNIGIPTIRGNMKSSYDYSKTVSKSISGALSVKVWMTSKMSVDIQELLMVLVDIKHLYSLLLNKYFIVPGRFVLNNKPKVKRNYWKKKKLRSWDRELPKIRRWLNMRRVIRRPLILQKKILNYYRTLSYSKNLDSYYSLLKNSLKYRTKKQLKSLFALSINRIKNKKYKIDSLPKTKNKLINI